MEIGGALWLYCHSPWFCLCGRGQVRCLWGAALEGGHVLLHDGLYPVVCCCGRQGYG
ncbi:MULTISPECIES: hypothetical protein [unclassified Bartonella]|uniref:hypothetical protein n=1 Tax=Bartonella TaxID=773 RepID=UPI0035CEAC7E